VLATNETDLPAIFARCSIRHRESRNYRVRAVTIHLDRGDGAGTFMSDGRSTRIRYLPTSRWERRRGITISRRRPSSRSLTFGSRVPSTLCPTMGSAVLLISWSAPRFLHCRVRRTDVPKTLPLVWTGRRRASIYGGV